MTKVISDCSVYRRHGRGQHNYRYYIAFMTRVALAIGPTVPVYCREGDAVGHRPAAKQSLVFAGAQNVSNAPKAQC